MQAVYDEIGHSYSVTRQPDPRIARAIRRALGEARTVLNVGAGTGSYEPADLQVVAVQAGWGWQVRCVEAELRGHATVLTYVSTRPC